MISYIKNYSKYFSATDFVVIVFYLFLTLLNLFFPESVKVWRYLILMNVVVIILVALTAKWNNNFQTKLSKLVHYWYPVPLIFITFKELYLMIKPIRQVDYDYLLIQIDRWIFGADPTVVLHKIAFPLLTEFLQIVYATFYFLPMILAVSLYFNKKYLEADYAIFAVIYGFFVSYIGYFFFPAIGPRFTLHDFAATNQELPGIFLTNFLREIINSGESIPAGTLNPQMLVQRDVFPSGHTMMTAIVMYLSVKFNSKAKWFLVICGSLLIFSTVYLRYHYVVDLLGGFLCMLFSLWSGKKLFNWWQKLFNKEILQ
ncbi:MAG: phosphatase PAP2 family protein [Ignavibacteriaceae bacterium]|nr:phosphatase PAP2 family protein [Ignavibacteriaceae bacterium]